MNKRHDKFIRINGIDFEYQRKPISQEQIDKEFRWAKGSDIYEAYAKPSQTKCNIWEAWCKDFDTPDLIRMAVSSASCHFFSIIAEDKHFFYLITAGHNRVWLKEKCGMVFSVVPNRDDTIEPFQFIQEV